MVSGYASPSPSSSPRSPLPVSVGPAHHRYYFSSSSHADITASFSLHHQLQHHYHNLHSTCSSCLLHLLNWFLLRCCTSSTTKRYHRVTHDNDCCNTMTT
ncbi:hypothetical protein HAX54_016604 [Datura stramonium]|uniref:Uncharacterized protein n=1 Tax=Datura stramonium TaxID=4076 RepID=A0ABS8UJ49_DATST|nr:hypothetical protein [Datura stramonium]